MGWLLWQKPVAQELSGQVKERLIAEFALDPLTVSKMRFSGKKGRYANRPVKYIRIFDPALLRASESAPPRYDAFALKDSRRSALLFEAHIEKIDNKEQVYFTDQRTPAALFPL